MKMVSAEVGFVEKEVGCEQKETFDLAVKASMDVQMEEEPSVFCHLRAQISGAPVHARYG